jgi:hypothetical protein
MLLTAKTGVVKGKMRKDSVENIIPASVLSWKPVYEFRPLRGSKNALLTVEEFLNGLLVTTLASLQEPELSAPATRTDSEKLRRLPLCL